MTMTSRRDFIKKLGMGVGATARDRALSRTTSIAELIATAPNGPRARVEVQGTGRHRARLKRSSAAAPTPTFASR